MRRLPIAAATAAVLTSSALATTTMAAGGRPSSGRSILLLADGTAIGEVHLRDRGSATEFRVSLAVPPAATPVRAFHGFHIHANDNPANGSGCEADPGAAPSTWFVSADTHLAQPGQRHGDHAGDLPASTSTPTAAPPRRLRSTGSISPTSSRVVVLHAGPDNFGNVPVGTAPNQYAEHSKGQ